MTVLHSGSNNRYSTNWAKAFGKGKSEAAAKRGAKKTPKKSTGKKR